MPELDEIDYGEPARPSPCCPPPRNSPTNNATIGRMPRVKVSVTVDPGLLNAVDNFVREHDELDRSKVIEQALTLWSAAQQATAMERQFAEPVEPLAEKTAWGAVRRAAAVKRLRGS